MGLPRHLLTALFLGSIPAAVFASGVYLDPATLSEHGMPVSLAALGVFVAGFLEMSRTHA